MLLIIIIDFRIFRIFVIPRISFLTKYFFKIYIKFTLYAFIFSILSKVKVNKKKLLKLKFKKVFYVIITYFRGNRINKKLNPYINKNINIFYINSVNKSGIFLLSISFINKGSRPSFKCFL